MAVYVDNDGYCGFGECPDAATISALCKALQQGGTQHMSMDVDPERTLAEDIPSDNKDDGKVAGNRNSQHEERVLVATPGPFLVHLAT